MQTIMILNIEPQNPIEVAKGISEYGLMAIMCGFYLSITIIMLIWIFRRFTKMTDDTITKQETILKDISSTQTSIVSILNHMNEGIRDKTHQQSKLYGQACIENTKYKILYEAERIKQENNLSNKTLVEKKIYTVALNLYNERGTLFDGFNYKGKPLMEYTSTEWVKKVTETIIDCIYAEDYSSRKLYRDLNITYNEILNEFFKNLTK